MEQNLPEKTILELNQAPEINLFTHHSLPLLIPVSEDFDYWKLCNFINIFYHYDFPTSFDYTDYKRYYAGLFDISCLEYGDLEDIDRESFWKRQLCKEKYIYLWLNQKYLPGSFSYRKKDDLHPVLLYAYDAERFFAKAFDVDNAVYGLDFSARELEEAFCKTQAESGQNINDDDMILLFKRKNFSASYIRNRHFVYPAFYRELSDYYFGQGSVKDWYHFFQENESYTGGHPELYGLKITELLLQSLKKETEIRYLDYRLVHMVTENKSLIAARLCELGERFDLSLRVKDPAEKYKALSGKYLSFRKLYMMMTLKETNKRTFYPVPRDPAHLKRLVSCLSALLAEEKELMAQIHSAVEENYMMSVFSPSIQKLEDAALKDGYCYLKIAGSAYSRIVTCSRNKIFCGFLEGSDGSRIDPERTLTEDSIMVFPLKSDISWIRYPVCEKEAERRPSFYGCRNTHFSDAVVSASSVLIPDAGKIPQPENVLIYDDQSFWTPAQSDRAPFLVFTLPKEDVFQSCAISEFEESVQIENFAIDVKTESGEWRELITLHKQERRKTFSAKFAKITGKEFRLRLSQGSLQPAYPIRISYFSLF